MIKKLPKTLPSLSHWYVPLITEWQHKSTISHFLGKMIISAFPWCPQSSFLSPEYLSFWLCIAHNWFSLWVKWLYIDTFIQNPECWFRFFQTLKCCFSSTCFVSATSSSPWGTNHTFIEHFLFNVASMGILKLRCSPQNWCCWTGTYIVSWMYLWVWTGIALDQTVMCLSSLPDIHVEWMGGWMKNEGERNRNILLMSVEKVHFA